MDTHIDLLLSFLAEKEGPEMVDELFDPRSIEDEEWRGKLICRIKDLRLELKQISCNLDDNELKARIDGRDFELHRIRWRTKIFEANSKAIRNARCDEFLNTAARTLEHSSAPILAWFQRPINELTSLPEPFIIADGKLGAFNFSKSISAMSICSGEIIQYDGSNTQMTVISWHSTHSAGKNFRTLVTDGQAAADRLELLIRGRRPSFIAEDIGDFSQKIEIGGTSNSRTSVDPYRARIIYEIEKTLLASAISSTTYWESSTFSAELDGSQV